MSAIPLRPGQRLADVAFAALLVVVVGGTSCAARTPIKGPSRQAHTHRHFTQEEKALLRSVKDRAERYDALHEEAALGIPRLRRRATPEKMLAHQRALADRIRALRADAREGDVLTFESRPLIKEILAGEFAGPENAQHRRKAIEGNPPLQPESADHMTVALSVNGTYPQAAALSSVPPHLLQRLPNLPKVLEYRFVGRDLILLDVDAMMIVDFISSATPPLRSSR